MISATNRHTRVSFIGLFFHFISFLFRVCIGKNCHSESKQTFTMIHPQVNIRWPVHALTVFLLWVHSLNSTAKITQPHNESVLALCLLICLAGCLCAFDSLTQVSHIRSPASFSLTHRWIMHFASFSIGTGVVSFVSRHKLPQWKYENYIFAFAIQIFIEFCCCWFVVCTRSIRNGYEHDHCFIEVAEVVNWCVKCILIINRRFTSHTCWMSNGLSMHEYEFHSLNNEHLSLSLHALFFAKTKTEPEKLLETHRSIASRSIQKWT